MFEPFFEFFAWLLSAFYSLVPNYAIAIAMLTVTVYLALFPVMLKQTRSGLAMARVQPELARLKKEHKGDTKALLEAQQALFEREGVKPAAACLPTLLQMPVFIILWQVLHGLTRRTAEGIPDPKHLEQGSLLYRDIVADGGQLVSFGVDLAKTALKGPHSSFGAALPFFALAALAGLTSYFQMKRSQGRSHNQGEQPPMIQTMTRIFPIMAVGSSLVFPAGLALYWVISNLFRIAQQEAMYSWDPFVVQHAKEAAAAIERKAVTDTTAKPKPVAKPKPLPEPKKQPGNDAKPATNGSDPAPVRESGRAQPKGTQGRRRKRKKSRR